MEVHAHTHTARKKWTHYFWEFLMLFLAVFCGFLAEYQLEHKIERDRAKELAKSFYEELKNDSVNITVKYQNRIRQENSLLYLRTYFRDSSMTNLSKTFVIHFNYAIMFRTPSLSHWQERLYRSGQHWIPQVHFLAPYSLRSRSEESGSNDRRLYENKKIRTPA